MMNFFNKYKQYQLFYLIAGFVVFVIIWFWSKSSNDDASNWTPNPTFSEAHTQASDADFEPDGTNVSPSTQSQLEALRLRVVKAPDDTTHLFRFARLLQDAHQPEEAARNYRHYLALHPDNYQAWLDMTQSLGQAKLWGQALEAVNDMLDRYPEDASALYNQGAVYANLDRFEDAKISLQKVIDQNKNPEVTALAENTMARLLIN